MKLRYLLIPLLILALFAPVGCEKVESTVILQPYLQPTVDKKAITVNISSKTVHLDPLCEHIETSKAENLRTVDNTPDAVNTLLSMDYHICKDCYE